jgi:hypothetical protein
MAEVRVGHGLDVRWVGALDRWIDFPVAGLKTRQYMSLSWIR